MKYIVLLAFIFSTSALTRELSYQEKLTLLPFTKTKNIKTYMLKNIDNRDLSIPDYFSFSIMKKACDPLSLLLKKIEKEDNTYNDQSRNISTLYSVCAEATLGLTSLYIKQVSH